MTVRVATCGCGRVQVSVKGDPRRVLRCHCDFCQKRSGSLFQAAAAFGGDQVVEITGDTTEYDGREIDGVGVQLPGGTELAVPNYFCSTCGTTVYWMAEGTDEITIGVGCFVDPSFSPATLELHTELRHRQVPPVAGARQFDTWPGA